MTPFDCSTLPVIHALLASQVRSYYASSGDEVRGFGQNLRLYLQPLSSTAANGGGGGVGATAPPVADTAGAVAAQGQAVPQRPPPQGVRIHPISDGKQTVFSQCPGGRISAGWALIVDGTVLLASEEVKPCFAVEFARRKQGGSGNGGEKGSDGQAGGKKSAGDEKQQEQQQLERVDYFTCGECKLNWLCASCARHCHGGCRDVKPFMLNHLPTWACCYCSKKRSPLGCKLEKNSKET